MTAMALDLSRVAQTNIALYRQMHDLGYEAAALQLACDAYELVCVPFAGHYRACGKPFVCHLVGTASVMAWLGAKPEAVVAALMHSVYEASLAFGNNVDQVRLTPARIRARVSEDVERLVAAYHAMPWNLDTLPALASESRSAHGERAEVLLLRLANELDDHLDCSMAYCSGERRRIDEAFGLWVEMAGSLGFPALADALRRCHSEHAECDWVPRLGAGRFVSYSPIDSRHGLLRRVRRRLRRMLDRPFKAGLAPKP